MVSLRTAVVLLGSGLLGEAGQSASTTHTAPSLQATESFITSKINDQGNVSFSVTLSNPVKQNEIIVSRRQVIQKDAKFDESCIYSEYISSSDDKGFAADELKIDLRQVTEIRVITGLQSATRAYAASQYAGWDLSETPNTFVLILSTRGGAKPELRFLERDIAERVAKAFGSAVSACGGGQEPF